MAEDDSNAIEAAKRANRLETVGNKDTMNLHNILYQNIISSQYFRSLYEIKTYHQVIDEIYNKEPFFKGNHASTAFCLLYKLWTLRLTVKQVQGLINHTDSPHIRALGFLYLRYVGKPADLWSWYEPYFDDDEEFQVEAGPKPRMMTMGRFILDLLTESKWLGTILPRIPVPIARELEKKLQERAGGNGDGGGGGSGRGSSGYKEGGNGDSARNGGGRDHSGGRAGSRYREGPSDALTGRRDSASMRDDLGSGRGHGSYHSRGKRQETDEITPHAAATTAATTIAATTTTAAHNHTTRRRLYATLGGNPETTIVVIRLHHAVTAAGAAVPRVHYRRRCRENDSLIIVVVIDGVMTTAYM
ncbi:PRP38 pre-mRNA processing factor 38 domain-containing protein B [Geranomyces michiganensis]|nr:PRP38 pre-mRNA processing factor 38 domain-containing protein B [Geranomyces michiganensis]